YAFSEQRADDWCPAACPLPDVLSREMHTTAADAACLLCLPATCIKQRLFDKPILDARTEVPPMADQSPSRGWRKDMPATAGGRTKHSAATAGRSSGAQRAWQKEAAVPGQTGKAWSKKTKIALGLVGSLLVVGAFVAVILLLRPPKPVYVLAVIAGYETNL